MKITTDWHIGVNRASGTTPQSAAALRTELRDKLAQQLDDNDHLIAGDLFDSFTVDTGELMATYNVFRTWLEKYGRRLVLLMGNHDYKPSGAKVSSFHLLTHILETQFPEQVVVVATSVTEFEQFILVPHLPNNDLLRFEIEKLRGVQGKVIVFHANVMNPHAAETQHSLNLFDDEVEMLCAHNLVVCGHEHQFRRLNNGKCIVLGNAYPSSIADCLGPKEKYAMRVRDTDYELVTIWKREGEYAEVEWEHLGDFKGVEKFVRVVGTAKTEQASDVVSAVARFRQSSSALVISNAVEVDGVASFEELEKTMVESIKSFDVVAAILSELTEQEQAVVKTLI